MAINNPYIPGDPFSYDLKWLVRKIKEHQIILNGIDERIQNAIIAALEDLDQLGPKYFETAADLIGSDLKDKSIAYIEGFYVPGDMGANLYYVTTDYNDIIGVDFYLTLDGPNRWALPIIVTPYVTPEMFGAYGDGIEDDTSAVEHAFKYKNVAVTKSYKVARSIPVISYANVFGSGSFVDNVPASTITYENPGVLNVIGERYVTIDGITFKGPGARTDATLINRSMIKIKDSQDVIVKNCKFYDVEASAVVRMDGSVRPTIEKCLVKGYTFTGFGCVNGCEDVKIVDNELYGLTGTYTNTYPITLSAHENVINITKGAICSRNIIDCPFPNWEAIDAHGGTDLIITDNIVRGSLTGIAVVEGAAPEVATNVVIKGNTVTLSTDTAYARAVNNVCLIAYGTNVTVADNILENGGVVCDGLGATRAAIVGGYNVDVHDNVIKNPNGGVFFSQRAYNMTIHHNIVYDWHWTTPGGAVPYFFLADTSTSFDDVFVNYNVARDCPATAMLGRVNGYLADNGGYMKLEHNSMFGGSGLMGYASQVVTNPGAGAPAQNGRIGDVIMNIAPAAGSPIGWVCTATYTNGTGGSWVALPNL